MQWGGNRCIANKFNMRQIICQGLRLGTLKCVHFKIRKMPNCELLSGIQACFSPWARQWRRRKRKVAGFCQLLRRHHLWGKGSNRRFCLEFIRGYQLASCIYLFYRFAFFVSLNKNSYIINLQHCWLYFSLTSLLDLNLFCNKNTCDLTWLGKKS